ncbi:hypothetical protein BDY24DRAFT_353656 [Mrakia frigida]|uniref:uncharacterized protein n=1 Tax=Mrakia frigida TaxID=29902 RepID=UPI003FCBFF05
MQSILSSDPEFAALKTPTKPTPVPPLQDPRTSLFYLSLLSLILFLLVPFLSLAFTKLKPIVLRLVHSQPTPLFVADPSSSDEAALLLDEDENEDEDDEPVLLVAPTPSPPRVMEAYGGTFGSDLKEHINQVGGRTIFLFNLVRFLGCLALLGLTIAAVVVDSEKSSSGPGAGGGTKGVVEILKKWKKGRKHKKEKGGRGRQRREEEFGREEWVELGQCFFFLYTTLLALLTLTLRKARYVSRQIKPHLSFLLLSAFALYAYRNLWPLATFHGHPLDIALHRGKGGDGWPSLVWWRVGLLGLVSVAVPLLVPRVYTAVDPENPSAQPSPEQTASLLSLTFYAHLTPMILRAWRLPSGLPFDSLPPLADYDQALYLSTKSMEELDPYSMPPGIDEKSKKKRERHVFWGILRIYWKEGVMLSALLVVKLVSDFARPLAINKLLRYIEKPTEAEVRPIFWIGALFLGPLLGSLAFQFYIFTSVRLFVRTEGLLSQLILNHSLRLRFVGKPEVASRSSSRRPSGTTTPALASTGNEDGSLVVGNGKAKGKSKASSTATEDSVEEPAVVVEEKSKSGDLVGRINNLIGSDLEAIVEGRDILIVLLFCPLQATLAIVFLYQIVSWSALVGLVTMIATFPLPLVVLRAMNKVQEELSVATDARVQAVTESMSSLRMMKMFAWEAKVEEKISLAREEELRLIRKKNLIGILNNNTNFVIPLISMTAVFASYTLLQGQVLDSSTIFSVIAVMELIQFALHALFFEATASVRGKVSLDRVNAFLHDSEVLDEFDEKRVFRPQPDPSFFGFRDATFAWLREDVADINVRNFRLHLDVEFVPGINIISGPTGSGKSSVLQALLGEMHFEPNSIDSTFNLPRSKGVAFVPQESWLQNATIRDNIILDLPFDASRFEKVVYACGLSRDLEILSGGDQTEVGEKGITLSGGQKARITLARAVYSKAKILLLDDVLSALDAHTTKWIVEECFGSELLKGRTVLLATHHIALVTPVASFILRLGRDGKVEAQGPVEKVMKQDDKLEQEVAAEKKEDARIIENESEKPSAPKADALVLEEEKSEGKVAWSSYKEFINGLGWRALVVFISSVLIGELLNTSTTWWLGRWGSQYSNNRDPKEVSVVYYLGIYAFIAVGMVGFYTLGLVTFYTSAVGASRYLHSKLVSSVLNSTFRWLDSTPVGRIIARFSKDFRAIDGVFALFFSDVVEITSILLTKFIGIIIVVPSFSIPAIIMGLIGTGLGELYIHAQLSVKREMSNAKSPLFNHLNGAINGVVSIRAYGIQNWIGVTTRTKVDKWTRTAVSFYDLNRWITIAIDTLANLFCSGLAAYLVYVPRGTDAGTTGWLLNISVAFSSHILWWVRIGNMFAVEANSLERIVDYFAPRIPQEPAFSEKAKPPASWPTSGDIVVENLTARYSDSGAAVLDGLSFSIRSGEKIGVVGRTGAGKSSLALALLRMVPTEGKVIIDGLDTKNINLSSLRTSVTIIPQDPILLSGSLRYNLDPFEENDDAVLNDALHASGLSSLQAGADMESAQTISLDTILSSGGSNLSQGQRQVLVLARALVRRSPIVIMDESTSSVDHETDEAIQRGIRRELSGVTIITIAHRLRSIADYDRLICLSEGKIIAYDTPKALLADPESYFSMLVKSSGEEDVIREMVKSS